MPANANADQIKGVQAIRAPYVYSLTGGIVVQFVEPAADGTLQPGATNEEVLTMLIHRVTMQTASHPHPLNTELLIHLTGALACQRERMAAAITEPAPSVVVRFGIYMHPIKSSNLEAYGYDHAKRVLALQFRGGRIYHYAGIPLDVYDGLLASESKGSYAAQFISGKFEGVRMDEAPQDA